MFNIKLSDEDLKRLFDAINDGADVPEDLLPKLSPGFFEKLRMAGKFDFKELDKYKIPTIEYAGKRSESVILAQAAITGGAAPLQIVRSFANGKNGNWKNLIVQGDNLQFLKTCYLNQDPLIKDKVKGKVKLIYIDPPFATKGEFKGSGEEKSYSDKIDTTEFCEALRERLIYLKGILSDDGCIYVHLDPKMSHYIKVIADEIYDKGNFINEIAWHYRTGNLASKKYQSRHDIILFYSNSKNYNFKPQEEKLYYLCIYGPGKKISFKGPHDGEDEYGEYKISQVDDVWDISAVFTLSNEHTNYPTQKPEKLLERILTSSTKEGDLVLDCFAGSGTTAAVAEKLGRRWIACDFGKHAIYTTQKRILNISDSKKLGNVGKNTKYEQPPKPFCVISAGAYDFSKIMDLRKNKDAYISFVLSLFSIPQEEVDLSKKYKLMNICAEKDNDPVEVYPVWDDKYLKDVRIDEDYLKGIIKAARGRIKGNYYIITPESCTNISDTTMKNDNNEKVNFKLLKFPYKVLEDVSRHFQIEEQPSSSKDINNLISSAGFYFNDEVAVKAEKCTGGFKITKFETKILTKDKKKPEGLEGLAMVLIDKDYDGKVFDMDETVYSKDIKDDGKVAVEGITAKSHIIAVDKHGNESKIAKIA